MLFLMADHVDAVDSEAETGLSSRPVVGDGDEWSVLLSGLRVEDDDEWSTYPTLPMLTAEETSRSHSSLCCENC